MEIIDTPDLDMDIFARKYRECAFNLVQQFIDADFNIEEAMHTILIAEMMIKYVPLSGGLDIDTLKKIWNW